VESYKKHLAGNSKVLMIHVSYDEEIEDALKWAKKEQFPWLTVPYEHLEATGLEEFSGEFVPEYLLLAPDGKQLAAGKEDCFKKIAAMKNEVAAAGH
jgi:hypothetical protein